jgi:hypothetical protein
MYIKDNLQSKKTFLLTGATKKLLLLAEFRNQAILAGSLRIILDSADINRENIKKKPLPNIPNIRTRTLFVGKHPKIYSLDLFFQGASFRTLGFPSSRSQFAENHHRKIDTNDFNKILWKQKIWSRTFCSTLGNVYKRFLYLASFKAIIYRSYKHRHDYWISLSCILQFRMITNNVAFV